MVPNVAVGRYQNIWVFFFTNLFVTQSISMYLMINVCIRCLHKILNETMSVSKATIIGSYVRTLAK